jgi:hypothetical protein
MQYALVSETNKDKLFSIIYIILFIYYLFYFFPFGFLWENMDVHQGVGIGFKGGKNPIFSARQIGFNV